MTTATKPKPKPDVRRPRLHIAEGVSLEVRAASAEETAAGFCGVMQAVAVPYDVVDSYQTTFKPGCLDKTRANKVAAKKVKLYLDHNYGVKTHVGVVTALPDIGGAAVMTAGLFDTVDGRAAKEYLAAVIASGAETGVSIGFFERAAAYEPDPDGDGDAVYAFSEIELDEISITPRNAVPGAVVTGVRTDEPLGDPQVAERALRTLALALPLERVRAIVDAALAERADPGDGTPRGEPAPTPEPPAADADDVPVNVRLEMLRAACAPLSLEAMA